MCRPTCNTARADLGIAGKDVLLEHGGDGLYQPVDLSIATLPHGGGGAAGFDYAGAVQRARA